MLFWLCSSSGCTFISVRCLLITSSQQYLMKPQVFVQSRCLETWANTIHTLGPPFYDSGGTCPGGFSNVSSPEPKVSQCFMIMAWFIWQQWVTRAGMRPFFEWNCRKWFPSLSEISDKTLTSLRGCCLWEKGLLLRCPSSLVKVIFLSLSQSV